MTHPVITDIYGENVFSIRRMREYLSPKAYESLAATITEGRSLDVSIADEVADAMKTWALSHGVTHFSHWFQPLTGATAEKHDSFVTPDRQGGAITQFSSKELIKGEPDASSFPSGGLRATFEARGYTAWDPTSPAFIKKTEQGGTLCIPSVFCSYHGEALDKKTPLLRSIEALSKQVCRFAKLLGIESTGKRAAADLGAEQEYFLVDRKYYYLRPDLVQTGRTLFGSRPAKHQQMSDHYFGVIKRRVVTFMDTLDRELWKLGIPARTRHNEVAPGQFEIAPVYEEQNLAVDHNMLIMETLRETAEKHGMACLLHEKPFSGVNGSGKHNNWNMTGPDGKNWLAPGKNPKDNARFLTMICALIKAADSRADLLRASVASAGNDLRLGAHEAPPAIVSMFLGDQLTKIIEQCAEEAFADHTVMKIGLSSLPPLPRDLTDRNRTSPLAFTGTKFEFRAVGSSQSCANANTILNTIAAEAIDDICTRLEAELKLKKDPTDALIAILHDIVAVHKRIIFNGDNYTKEWEVEAARRGLPNIRTTPEALKVLIEPHTVSLFEKYQVLSGRELQSRYEVYRAEYDSTVEIEAHCAATMAKTMIVPAAVRYQETLSGSINGTSRLLSSDRVSHLTALLSDIAQLTESTLHNAAVIEQECKTFAADRVLVAMRELRTSVDALESLLPADMWPLPTYASMLFTL